MTKPLVIQLQCLTIWGHWFRPDSSNEWIRYHNQTNRAGYHKRLDGLHRLKPDLGLSLSQ